MLDELRQQAECTSKAMLADLGTSYRASLALPTVAGFQTAWNELLPQVRGIAGVLIPSKNGGQLVADGLYGAQTQRAALNFLAPGTPTLPTRAADMPTWFAQNHNMVEGMCPPAPPPAPVPAPITTAPYAPPPPIQQAYAPPAQVVPPPPPPVAPAPAPAVNPCYTMWRDWLAQNPNYAKCLSRADEAVWMQLCGLAATGQITFEQGAGGWAGHVTKRCNEQAASAVRPPPVQQPVQVLPTIEVSAPVPPALIPEVRQGQPVPITAAPPTTPWGTIAIAGAVGVAAVVGGLTLMRRS